MPDAMLKISHLLVYIIRMYLCLYKVISEKPMYFNTSLRKRCMELVYDLFLEYRSKTYSNTCVKRPSQKDRKLVFKSNYRLMQVKSIAECYNGEHSAILSTFIKLPFVIKTFVLSIFERQFYTGITVLLRV